MDDLLNRPAVAQDKCTEVLTIRMSEELLDTLKYVARVRGYPDVSKYVRDHLDSLVNGERSFIDRRIALALPGVTPSHD